MRTDAFQTRGRDEAEAIGAFSAAFSNGSRGLWDLRCPGMNDCDSVQSWGFPWEPTKVKMALKVQMQPESGMGISHSCHCRGGVGALAVTSLFS